ncbi:UPF0149 family protein [Alteromonas halophila]|uniref:YecA family protein n=1 Tax=Alteromonas halophila TaxID=516698 RepID=A0A918N088_9ALTE|nr:UPF0149 family protein [Alteromonas halophila]GGW92385.1 hypothetical protein GCM10007391_28440 [Alteromonas halophila]
MQNQQAKFDLEAYLALYQPVAKEGLLKPPFELLGLITAISSSPELIVPSEWYPFIWNDHAEDPAFETSQQAEQLLGYLLQWSNYCTEAFVQQHELALPAELDVDEAGAPTDELVDFAQGYLLGQDWLKEVWDAFIPDDESEESSIVGVTMLLMMQCIQPNTRESEEYPDLVAVLTKKESANKTLAIFLSSVGNLGCELYEQQRQQSSAPYHNAMKKVGRNDPCPCGSGRKYKKCCLS